VDWFFAENYVYRRVAELTGFWRDGRDPFTPIKLEEYAGAAHRQALMAAAEIAAESPSAFAKLLEASVFGNRIDLSFKASLDRGTHADSEDLLLDDRELAVRALEHGTGPVHLIIDNAGSELSVDLVLVSALLDVLNAPVTLHMKVHPAFVSDAIVPDLDWFLASGSAAETAWRAAGTAALGVRERLRRARTEGRLRALVHPFWNGPLSLWEMPSDLARAFDGARLVILKGDAHYRRAVGDALWSPDTPFAHVTSYFEWPLLALRTLKSDPIVGLAPGQALELDQKDSSWRVNGRRGVASAGGRLIVPVVKTAGGGLRG
jgi:uncharacterized protein with ATP-grasp and redox domains